MYFMDVKDINSGRFKNVIHNEIAKRDSFIVVLSPGTCGKLASQEDWVRRELELALELKKNVIPVLIDGVTIQDIPASLPIRDVIVSLNALNVNFDYFDEAIHNLYNRYLMNPTIQELEFEVAEEHYEKGLDAHSREDWKVAELEFEKAVSRVRRPEYLLGLGVAKHRQGRNPEALSDINAAIAMDPFGWKLMEAKFDILQNMDKMKEAIDLPAEWERQARNTANAYASRIFAGLENGLDLLESAEKNPAVNISA